MFGIHISKETPIGTYLELDESCNDVISHYKLNALQIFTHGPRHFSKNKINVEELKKIGKVMPLYIHTTYLTDGYWGAIESGVESKINKYIGHIQDQLDAGIAINARGIVIHITRKPANIILKGMQILQKSIVQENVQIILEFRAMKSSPSSSYETAEKLINLTNKLSKITLNWGYCIDTSHMWSTGIDMSNLKIIQSWFKDIEAAGIASKIILFHLNAASNNTFNVGKDIHVVPFADEDDIWGSLCNVKKFDLLKNEELLAISKSSLGYLLNWAKKNNVPLIGEFKRGSNKEYTLAIQVIQKLLA